MKGAQRERQKEPREKLQQNKLDLMQGRKKRKKTKRIKLMKRQMQKSKELKEVIEEAEEDVAIEAVNKWSTKEKMTTIPLQNQRKLTL